MSEPKLPPIRRVITGHDANNLDKVIIDGPATNAKTGASGATSTLIWSTDHLSRHSASKPPVYALLTRDRQKPNALFGTVPGQARGQGALSLPAWAHQGRDAV